MRTPTRGFTLIEIMVVLVLVGIITSFALLAVGGGPQERLAEEARRLAALVELHQQEAILRGEPRGIRFTRAGYAILSLGEKGQWQPLTAAATLVRHELPKEIALGLWIEGQRIDLKAAPPLPQILLLASGEVTEFVTTFSLADAQQYDTPLYQVAGDFQGRLTVGAVNRR
ncbi:MAG: type II secretion system minor pseudopilin GspH [Candidatus Competibacteraceae bacterium]